MLKNHRPPLPFPVTEGLGRTVVMLRGKAERAVAVLLFVWLRAVERCSGVACR